MKVFITVFLFRTLDIVIVQVQVHVQSHLHADVFLVNQMGIVNNFIGHFCCSKLCVEFGNEWARQIRCYTLYVHKAVVHYFSDHTTKKS